MSQQCEWRWNGEGWDQLSGPVDCEPPPIPRGDPGMTTWTNCDEAHRVDDPQAIEETCGCSDAQCDLEETVVSIAK